MMQPPEAVPLDLPPGVEAVFKIVPPVRLAAGHGYQGVVLRRKRGGLIQCHICGKWWTLLGRHVSQNHDMTTDQYRVRYGLPLGFPLCSRAYSRKRNKIASRPENLARLAKHTRRDGAALLTARSRRRCNWTKACAAMENQVGACADQLRERYVIASDAAGHQATMTDIRHLDSPLDGLIIRRYGSLNAFRAVHGFDQTPRAPRQPRVKLLALGRKWMADKGWPPTARDFAYKGNGMTACLGAVIKRFGSWRSYLSALGCEHMYRRHRMGRIMAVQA